MIKDPDTGRCVSRINPPDKWEFVDRPDLRIVDEVLFEKRQTCGSQRNRHLLAMMARNQHRRPSSFSLRVPA